MRRAATVAVVATALVAAACSGGSELSAPVRAVIGDDNAGCVEDALDADAIDELNRSFDDGPALSTNTRTALARAYAECTGGTLALDTSDGTSGDGSGATDDPAADDDVGTIGQDAVDPDAVVVAGPGSPLPLGSTVTLAGWEITVLDAYADTSERAERSSEGGLYVITVRGTNRGEGESDLFFDVDWGTIAADGTIYENTCNVALDDDLAFADSAPVGATQEGSFCLTMPASVAADVTDFYLQESLTDDQAIAWFTTA